MSEMTHEWLKRVSREERRATGKAVRDTLPLAGLAEVGATMAGRDPVALIGARDAGRLEWLVPIRYGRMLRSAFTFYRGSAALMAHDLAFAPSSGLTVQLCGDAHLLNFGIFGSPERSLVFDLNDFDETLPGPFEWDVKRLVASVVVAARDRGFKPKRQREIAFATAERYRTAMREFAEMTALETWHRQLEVDVALQTVDDEDWRAYASAVAERARGKNHLQAVSRFTEVVDGKRRIVTEPPLIVPLASVADLLPEDPAEVVRQAFMEYRGSVRDDIQVLLDRYTYVDAAIKVVGVGSVGTRCVIVLMQGADENDLLFLQVKQAGTSVLEPYLAASQYTHSGERVVAGQRLMQSASDAFLGWATGPIGHHYYWRQLRDWKGSADVEKMSERLLLRYGQVCAWTLAKAHARSGDSVAIGAYLGSSNRFETAITSFGVAYADVNEQDYLALQEAVADGRVVAHDDAELPK
jgi:hypothetical protein